MEHSVKLSAFPGDVQFPPELQAKIRYDADKRRLIFEGHMWKSQYDRLVALHDELEYHRALEELFRISTEPIELPDAPSRIWVALATGAAAILLGVGWYVLRSH